MLANNTRTSVLAHITNMIDPFLMEPYATVFAGRSTERIDQMIAAGRILYVHMPVADKEAMSKVVGTFVKLEYFRQIRELPTKPAAPSFSATSSRFISRPHRAKGMPISSRARSRQSNHANIVAVQNLPALDKLTRTKTLSRTSWRTAP